MAGFSTYYAQQLINDDFVNGATKYLALFVADPTDNNVTNNEVTGAWYGRVAVNGWAAPVGSGVSTSNTGQLSFNATTGSAVTVSHWGLYDAASAGHLIASGALDVAKVLNVDDVFVVDPGTCVIAFD